MVDVPLLLGAGHSNEIWTVPGTRVVDRRPTGDLNALDLRVVGDIDAQRALREAYPRAYVMSSWDQATGQGLFQWRLDPHQTDPSSSEAAFDEAAGHLIDELGYLSHHSEIAAHALAPKARQSVEILRSLPDSQVPLRCAPDVSDSGLSRAFAIRVAEVVTPVIGERVARGFGLPTPRQFARDLARGRDDHGKLVLAHGDPTVHNFMWASGEVVLTDWEMARPAPEVSAAAHTLAALVTRAPYPLRQERIAQFVSKVAGAGEAINSGLYAVYYEHEVGRSIYADVLRGLRGDVDPELVHRNVQRFLGDNAPSLRRVKSLLKAHGDGEFPIPVLPYVVRAHLAERPSTRQPPSERIWTVSALENEVSESAAATLPPAVNAQHRDFLTRFSEIVPAPTDSVIERGKRLREAGKTEVTASTQTDRMSYEFRTPQNSRQSAQRSGRQGQAQGLAKHKGLQKGT